MVCVIIGVGVSTIRLAESKRWRQYAGSEKVILKGGEAGSHRAGHSRPGCFLKGSCFQPLRVAFTGNRSLEKRSGNFRAG